MQLAVWSGQAELVKQHIEAGQQAVNIEEPWVSGIGCFLPCASDIHESKILSSLWRKELFISWRKKDLFLALKTLEVESKDLKEKIYC